MKVVHRLLLGSALGVLLPSAIAQTCPNLIIYYGNGVGFGNDNVKSSASDARNQLRSEVTAKLTSKQSLATRFELALNPSEGILLDALEAARQQLGTEYPALATALILRIADLTPVLLALQATLSPEQVQAFNNFFQNRTVQELIQGTSSTATVDAHYNHYNLDIPGKRVILVAHSQGNIFANLAYQRLSNFQRLFFADVSVASPESVEPASRLDTPGSLMT